MIPQDYKYLKSHEWAKIDGDVATVGITDFAVGQLGDIVFLELPKVGAKVNKDSAMCVIESVKAAVDINAPVSGEVMEVNTPLTQDFETLGKDPYGQGWMVKIKIRDAKELSSLLGAAEYKKVTEEEPKH
ncbi:MAG: glycine cleavage system protein GcvH [Planctomycetes bacterium]|nr:glycine cleavage system protein GcvH [Planctomycetota bacterium]